MRNKVVPAVLLAPVLVLVLCLAACDKAEMSAAGSSGSPSAEAPLAEGAAIGEDCPFVGAWANRYYYSGEIDYARLVLNKDGTWEYSASAEGIKMWGKWTWGGGDTAMLHYNGEEMTATLSGDKTELTWNRKGLEKQ